MSVNETFFNCTFVAMNIQEWPSAKFLGVSRNNRLIMFKTVTSRLSLIEGRSGPKKTQILHKIIKILLQNEQKWQSSHSADDRAPVLFLSSSVNRLLSKSHILINNILV